MAIELLTGKDVAALNSLELPKVMNALLTAEAGNNRVSISDLDVTLRSTDPDGGVDARITWPANATHDILDAGVNVLQFKSGALSKAQIEKEFAKPGVRAALRAGGTYILCLGFDYAGQSTENRKKALRALCKSKRIPVSRAKMFFGSQLARWLSRYPAVAALPEFGKRIPDFQTVSRWKQDNRLLTTQFRADASRQEIIANIGRFIDSDSGDSVLRLEGPAGVGKTRLALESVLDERISSRTLYAPNADGDAVQDVIQAFYGSPEVRAVLVVDECERTRQDLLAQYAENSGGRLKLICVGIAEVLYATPPPIMTPFYQLKPLQNEDVEAILVSSFPTAPKQFVDTSVRLASGYIKLAVFIVDVLVRNGFQPAVSIARVPDVLAFLRKFVPKSTLKSLQVLSALARIGWEEELQQEAKVVAKFVGLPFPRLKMEAKQLRDLGVVVPRGRYLYVSPDLLAVNAAADLWDTEGAKLIKLVEKFPAQEPRKQLLRRLAMMGGNTEVKKAVQGILSRKGLFPTLAQLNDPFLSEVFRILSSAAPSAATELLVETIGNALRQELLDFRNGRRNVIWAVESLLRWPDTSFDAARSLMMLALSETETIANNATGVLKTYFHLFLSGSPLPLNDRFVLVDELIEMADPVARSLAVKLASGCLEFNEWRSGGEVDPLSNSAYPPEWRPKTYGEIWELRRRALGYLETIGSGIDDAAKSARQARLHSITALVQHGQFDDAIALLESAVPTSDEERRAVVDSCVRIDEIPDLSEQNRSRLQRIRDNAFGSTFIDRLRRWVGKRTNSDYDLKGNTGFASADTQVTRLADEAFEKGLNADELSWLASAEADNVWLFGRTLGELDTTGRFQSAIVDSTPDNIDCLFLASYIWARSFNGIDDDREAVINEIEVTRPNAAFGATFRGTPTEAGAQRIIRLISSRRVHPSALRALMYGLWIQKIPGSYTVQIVNLALDLDMTQGLESALRIIDQTVHHGSVSVSQFGETIWRALEARPAGRGSSTFDWQWARVAEMVAKVNPIRLARAFIGLFESEDTWVATDSSKHTLQIATETNPAGVWKVIGDAMLRTDSVGMRLRLKLDHWYGELLPPNVLLEWAARTGPKGFMLAANSVSVKSGSPSEAARRLVKEAPNPKEVLARIFASLYSGGAFAGPISGFMERRLETLKKLAKDKEPRIRDWAKAEIRYSEKGLKRQKLLEEEDQF